VLGPSASSAKARVMFAVDGLEVKIWGTRDDRAGIGNRDGYDDEKVDGEDEELEDDDDDDSSEEGAESESSSDEDNDDPASNSDSGSSDLELEVDSSADSIIDGTPPPSRSPSPTSSHTLSRSPSPSNLLGHVLGTPQDSFPSTPQPQPAERKSEPDPEQQQHYYQTPTYASEQEALRTAERLLSRTLANACAEDDGRGMAAEIGSSPSSSLLPS
jgi:hypothetical protein